MDERDEAADDGRATGMDRRNLIKVGAAAGAAAWVVPQVVSMSAAAAGTSTGSANAPLYSSNPFTCPTGATDLSAPVQGAALVVTISVTPTTASATVSTDGSGTPLPDGTYDLYLNQDPGGCPTPGGVASCNASVVVTGGVSAGAPCSIPRAPGATAFWISLVGPLPGGGVYRSTAVNL